MSINNLNQILSCLFNNKNKENNHSNKINLLKPVCNLWGYSRGNPIDRYYIEKFLENNSAYIKGHVLEVGDDSYTKEFGKDKVNKSDILNAEDNQPNTTIVADLNHGDHIPSDMFDCIIITQTLHLIYDVKSAIKTLYRILKPNGVLLATFPGITRISTTEWPASWYWSFTSHSTRKLFGEIFGNDNIVVNNHGNVLTSTAFLYGFACEELSNDQLEYNDPNYELLITLKAIKM